MMRSSHKRKKLYIDALIVGQLWDLKMMIGLLQHVLTPIYFRMTIELLQQADLLITWPDSCHATNTARPPQA